MENEYHLNSSTHYTILLLLLDLIEFMSQIVHFVPSSFSSSSNFFWPLLVD